MIETVPETGSTNADLLSRLSSGEAIAEGYWLRAEQQRAGRGRSGRKWLSAAGNLYASTVVNLRKDDPPAHTLSLVAGTAVWDMLREQIGVNANLHLKWPNDIIVRKAKIAGILLERTGDSVVVGIGINVRFAPEVESRQTTSIHAVNSSNESGPDRILQYLAKEMAYAISLWRSDGLPGLLRRWSDRAFPIGTGLSVNVGDGEQAHGTFAGLDQAGSLLLRLENGEVRTIHAGDVSLIAEGKS
ncbi:biotin--[acetyl-CoA-carboxylase] ligase [Qipengyuania sp. ASV99]|uniref:biotin--[acetyl-CoA-carboxylase] ligase n=1 Tax=Qipengyuania sp. ASV99 TaxID=3399681 RepID=UPI003A4C6227